MNIIKQECPNKENIVSILEIDTNQWKCSPDVIYCDNGIVGTVNSFKITCHTLIFDFANNRVYLDANRKDWHEFDCDAIIPAVAMCDTGELIEVSKYELVKHEFC